MIGLILRRFLHLQISFLLFHQFFVNFCETAFLLMLSIPLLAAVMLKTSWCCCSVDSGDVDVLAAVVASLASLLLLMSLLRQVYLLLHLHFGRCTLPSCCWCTSCCSRPCYCWRPCCCICPFCCWCPCCYWSSRCYCMASPILLVSQLLLMPYPSKLSSCRTFFLSLKQFYFKNLFQQCISPG